MATTLFNDSELSSYDGRPVMLYKFVRGTLVYLYAESDRDITVGNDTYTAVNVNDDGVSMTGNATQDTFVLRIPSSTALAQAFIGTAPSQQITLTVLRYHPGDADAIVNYVGQVQQVSQKSPGMAEVQCVSLSSTFRRDGLRIAWERSCPYALYDMNCKVSPSSYGVQGIITSIYGNTLQFPAAAMQVDGYWSGGYAEWNLNADTLERRGIQNHQGQSLEMFGLADKLYEGQRLTIYPGCGRNTVDCTNKFNNLANYGGVPMLPGKSPFDGSPVF